MTDARFPERWLNDSRFRRLTDKGYRTYFNALAWAVANRSDGKVLPEELRFIPDVSIDEVDRLVELKLWQVRRGGGWKITDYESTQTSRDQLEGLEHKKRQDRDRARDYRGRQKNETASRDESRDESRDDIGQDRPGQARTGQASNADQLSDEEKEERWNEGVTTPWPSAVKRAPDGGRKAS